MKNQPDDRPGHAPVDRRSFLRAAGATGLGLALGSSDLSAAALNATRWDPRALPGRSRRPIDTVRIGMVGVGHQGTGHVRNFLRIPNAEIRAIADIVPEHAERSRRLVEEAGAEPPRVYTGEEDYLRMAAEEDLDLIFTATPWKLHHPVMKAALEHGKHAATEVPMAVSLEECWELVELSESTGLECVMMENCCYDRTEMMILNMVRQGVFGGLLHAECGYLHDLRELKLSDYYVNRWRVDHSVRRDGDLYPTHGIGPVAQWFDINRGNQFDYLVSMGSPSMGLQKWAEEHIGPDSMEARRGYRLSDVVNTLIKTKRGETILITHDTNTPRPYTRKVLLQGTNGLIRKYPEQRIHIEGTSPAHRWEDALDYREQYEHPIWKALEEESAGAGHGGMDYIEDYRLIQCLRSGERMDFDVYDGAAWTAVIMLSEQSIAARSEPQPFPDFTRGAWRSREPLGIVEI
ncbi:MAG TPA: Gfo/Idh/MocA family oxidoreductase [Longimicrobiales bacterium]|nr:Gfo/Idh/MocA family oxidoreductase [Longimicrobiales bacterium]